jgi:hypothetical protein
MIHNATTERGIIGLTPPEGRRPRVGAQQSQRESERERKRERERERETCVYAIDASFIGTRKKERASGANER